MAQAKQMQSSQSAAWLVFLVTLVALFIGWGVKTSTQNSTRPILQQNLTAQIPTGWIAQEAGNGGLLAQDDADPTQVFATWDPMQPEQRYSVSLLPSAGISLPDVAAVRNLSRAQNLDTYRILDQTPVVLEGREGYKVSFAYVDADGMDIPTIVRGIDYYFLEAEQTIVVTLEAAEQAYAAQVDAFQTFALSVSFASGE